MGTSAFAGRARRAGAGLAELLRSMPAVIVAVLLAAVAGQWWIDDRDAIAGRLLAVCSMAVPGLVATATWRAARDGDRRTWVADAAVVGVALLLLVTWERSTLDVAARRLLQLELAALLAVAALPTLSADARPAFWAWNRTLFLRFVLSSAFTLVLFAGLSVAILSLERLFGLDVPDDAYMRLLVALVTVFHPLHVLAGVPRDPRRLLGDETLPAALDVLARLILLPLVVVYLTILLAYLGRVVLTQQWPSGWIGHLVSAVAVVGLLAVLLLHPRVRREPDGWVARAALLFHVAMIPALAMLAVALGKRVAQYGVTEDRYFLGVLAAWMLALCLLRVTGRRLDPWWIPASLAIVAVVSCAGPWGAYAVSRADQSARFERALRDAGRLREGVAVPADRAVDDAVEQRAGSALLYLARVHGRPALRSWFDDSALDAAARAAHGDGSDAPTAARVRLDQPYVVTESLLESVGLRLLRAPFDDRTPTEWIAFEATGAPMDVRDSDVAILLELAGGTGRTELPGGTTVDWTTRGTELVGEATDSRFVARFDLADVVAALGPSDPAPTPRMPGDTETLPAPIGISAVQFEAGTTGVQRVGFLLLSLDATLGDGPAELLRVRGLLLLGLD